jgi:hypothetical protein
MNRLDAEYLELRHLRMALEECVTPDAAVFIKNQIKCCEVRILELEEKAARRVA